MNRVLTLALCISFLFSLLAHAAKRPRNAPMISDTMFQSAVASTTLLGWWQFDTPGGAPTKQGWTEHDLTAQLATYFHVDGIATTGGCHGFAAINGNHSMWCGQYVTALDPWCGWSGLPGYGNNWDQQLTSNVGLTVNSVTYTIKWDSEPGRDFTYVEWWDPVNLIWVADPTINGATGSYTSGPANGDPGGPQTETSVSLFGATKMRFHFTSDGAGSDEDGLWDTVGAVMLDDLAINGGPVEDWEGEACGAQQSSDAKWVAAITPAFGLYSGLVSGAQVVQEDPCVKPLSNMWEFFDNPSVTNYACGGWPLQGAVAYGPDPNGLYINNEVWSPWVPITGSGNQYRLQFLVYKDLHLDNLLFFTWGVRTRDGTFCPANWADEGYVYYGGHKFWLREWYELGEFVPPGAVDIQIALGAVDMCQYWCGIYGSGTCHSHAPLFDQVRLVRVAVSGPQWSVRHVELFQDNFPEEGGVGPFDYARCDMAQDILTANNGGILPGDSAFVRVSDPNGLAFDATGGRNVEALYAFVKVTDRFGTDRGYTAPQIQSPDNKSYVGDVSGFLRYPYVAGIAPVGWYAYRMDRAYSSGGGRVKNGFCCDLMDLGSGATGPHYKHGNENVAANVGIFAPGDVVNYFFAAKNTLNQWSYFHRTLAGQGNSETTTNISVAIADPMEWSVLPDRGRLSGDLGDILYVDDADDRGGPAQISFDWAFQYLNIKDRVDRFDILDPSAFAGNSLASRVKSVVNQIIGDPTEVYQKILWDSDNRESGLIGDGGPPNGGSGANKSDDFGLCYTFLDQHPDNPGWAYWGDNVVVDWSKLTGLGAMNVRSIYMNYVLVNGDQRLITGIISPKVYPVALSPWVPETFYAFGGCPIVNRFDSVNKVGTLAGVSHLYNNSAAAPAAVYQATPNAAGSTARFHLAGFGYNYIRDDDTTPPLDRVNYLKYTLQYFQNAIGTPIGIDPVAFANRLEDNYPNPFNPTTTIKYSIADAGHVTLRIYDAAGQLVRTLVDGEQAPRAEGFSLDWNGTNNTGQKVSSGVYFYKLVTKDFARAKKMVLLK